jgi:UDP-GlcNAc:undecaprenyl-phosphate/decaprenyl-phosphate GlcNAc-1-phosphate transferase
MLNEWVFHQSLAIRGLLWGCSLVILLGIADDRWGVDALIKLAGQVLAASVMVFNGLQIDWLPVPGLGTVGLDPTTATVLSILIAVVMMNAVNFVDGLDGLAGGMAAIAATAFFLYGYRLQVGYFISSAAPAVMVSAIVIGMCAGFLCHNWAPARIFMGDSGSMLLGLLLAGTTILAIGQIDPDQLIQAAGSQTAATHKGLAVYIPLVLPFFYLALPMADMIMAVVRRTRAGMSPFAADKGHLHHRLLQFGHSKQTSVLIMYLWAGLLSLAVLLVTVTPQHRAPILVAMVLLGLGLLYLLLPIRKARRSGATRHDGSTRQAGGPAAAAEAAVNREGADGAAGNGALARGPLANGAAGPAAAGRPGPGEAPAPDVAVNGQSGRGAVHDLVPGVPPAN